MLPTRVMLRCDLVIIGDTFHLATHDAQFFYCCRQSLFGVFDMLVCQAASEAPVVIFQLHFASTQKKKRAVGLLCAHLVCSLLHWGGCTTRAKHTYVKVPTCPGPESRRNLLCRWSRCHSSVTFPTPRTSFASTMNRTSNVAAFFSRRWFTRCHSSKFKIHNANIFSTIIVSLKTQTQPVLPAPAGFIDTDKTVLPLKGSMSNAAKHKYKQSKV